MYNSVIYYTEEEEDATHVVYPVVDPLEEEYARPVFRRGNNVLVHWYYMPDSHDTWAQTDLPVTYFYNFVAKFYITNILNKYITNISNKIVLQIYFDFRKNDLIIYIVNYINLNIMRSFLGRCTRDSKLGVHSVGAVACVGHVGARLASVQRVDERGGLRGRPHRKEEGTFLFIYLITMQ